MVRAAPALVRHHVRGHRYRGHGDRGYHDRFRRRRVRAARRAYLPGNRLPDNPARPPGPRYGQYPGPAEAREILEAAAVRNLRHLGHDRPPPAAARWLHTLRRIRWGW